MSMDRLSVRQWQEQFRAGTFESKDVRTQVRAGWYDWFCGDEALSGRLKKIARVVMGITDPFILDHYYIWFKNNCPMSGPLYDDVRFEPLSGERDSKYFVVSLDSPHDTQKWSLYTERHGFDRAEFECANIRDMIAYINDMGRGLGRDANPASIDEHHAVRGYMLKHDHTLDYPILKIGDHRFLYETSPDHGKKTIIVAHNLKDAPPDFAADRAEQYGGLYLYCPEDAERAAPEQKRPKPSRKRGAER